MDQQFEQLKEFLTKYKSYVIAAVIALVCVGIGLNASKQNSDTELVQTASNSNKQIESHQLRQKVKTAGFITIDIAGAVKKQGVYRLRANARIQDAILAAGGLAKNADLKQVNRAQSVQDQAKIYIPYQGETSLLNDQEQVETETASNSDKINLNTASKDDLLKLNGIGDKKAEQIIAYREQNGEFKSVEELKNVSGIGEKTLANLKDQVTV